MDVLASNTSSKRDSFYSCYSRWLVLVTAISALLLTLTPFPALPIESPIHFTDVTDVAGIYFKHADGAAGEFHLPETLGAGGAFLDYDNDGDLDLYLVNSAAPSMLYRNNGNGTFTDITPSAGIDNQGSYGHGVACGDYDNDGYVDIYVTNFGANRLYHNNGDTPNYLFYNKGDGTFAEIAILTGCAYSADGIAQAGMGVDAGDYNGDGFLDLFVTNFSYETNTLYRNNGDGTFTDVSYKAQLGEESYLSLGFGTGFFDADNDGHLDIFVANGHIFPTVEQTTDVLSYRQPNQLFWNQGDATFAEVRFDDRPAVSRGTLFGDYDNDGDTDLLVTQLNGTVTLLRNESQTSNHWLRVKLIGTRSNRDGIGARITLTIGSESQTREVRMGSSYLSSNDPRVLLGVGEQDVVDKLEIRWQSGVVQVLENLTVNQELVVTEPLSEVKVK
ncbi:MAG: CRTAC1 family protein [Candidatus Poribacteria bacterium]|nr:CRTAC1 family protein [Candidatus Poribacteria bacterium]